MEKLKIGLIGAGFIGELHADVLSDLPTAELVAVADLDMAKAEAFGKKYACDCYDNYEKLLARPDIQAVYICLPDRYHVEPAIAAAKAGKHLMVEKPLARTVADSEKIRRAATENGVRLMVGHLLRFDPRYVQLHQQIEAGNLGELLHIRVKRQNPNIIHDRLKGRTSMLYYVGIHDIDAMLWCMHEEPVEVYAKRVAKVHTEDCIFILCSFRNGTVGSLEFSWSLPKSFPTGIWSELEVVGTKGAASIDNLDQGLKLCTDKYSIPDTYLWSKYNGRRLGDIREESIHFIDAVLHNKDFLMPVGDAIKSVAFIEACFESIAAEVPVKIKAGENV